MAKTPTNPEMHGIGIIQFLRGKHFLITGGTGFLAKVLIEKILREVPDVGKIYLLIKAKNGEAAMQRLKTEVLNIELFKVLEKAYGQSYNDFVSSKLVPVVGNICDSDLGLEQDIASQIAHSVDVIVNSAATTTFDERYDVALNINTKGPCNLIRFAKKCNQLKLFLHVSTAYVNGERQGKIMEKLFRMGDCIASENLSQGSLPPVLDVEAEFQFASTYSEEVFSEDTRTKKLKEMGITRAKMFGWQDTYVFTKAMGEMMIDNSRENIHVVIVRPSIIGSTLSDPFPGWIQGNRMLDPIILSYGEGKIPGFPTGPKFVLDVVPADMVASAILAATARHASMHQLGGSIQVYHVGSSVANPIITQDMLNLWYEHFHSNPCIGSNGMPIEVSPFIIFSSTQNLLDTLARNLARKEFMRSIKHMCDIYVPYSFYAGRFDISNTLRLMEEMSEEEKKKFQFDVRVIDWKYYIKNVHVFGLKKHVMTKCKIESML